jgi:subtilisin family serine protease
MRTFALTIIATIIIVGLSWHEVAEPGQGYLLESDKVRIEQLTEIIRSQYPAMQIKAIYPSLGFYSLIQIDARATPVARSVLDRWQKNGLIDAWYEDRLLTLRTTPNDPLWLEQWDLERIDLTDVWDVTTGGVTSTGDTIVVAILDRGYDTDHPDLNSNYWRNSGEIPNDSIDNDMNGYIDDYMGLNIQDGSDVHPVESHGTSVSGIIGAVGNNDIGVSGVNWSVKMLPVSGIKKESDLIEAYHYVMQFRKRYNESGGREGAFVVVTNSSIGIDGAWADDHPMWCATYDDMGEVGILSVASTTNLKSLVDEDGDMPSTCPSSFLITVTNTDIDDNLYKAAGYGPIYVDLGAPGNNSITTVIDNSYGDFDGTSAAAPHVAGAIALLYSVPCEELMNEVNSDPVSAALRLKSLLLASVDTLESLNGKTATSGRLNVNSVLKRLCITFGAPPKDLAIKTIYPNPGRGSITIEMSTSHFDAHDIRIFDSIGRLVYETQVFPSGELFEYQFSMPTAIPGYYVALLEHDNDRASYAFVVQ